MQSGSRDILLADQTPSPCAASLRNCASTVISISSASLHWHMACRGGIYSKKINCKMRWSHMHGRITVSQPSGAVEPERQLNQRDTSALYSAEVLQSYSCMDGSAEALPVGLSRCGLLFACRDPSSSSSPCLYSGVQLHSEVLQQACRHVRLWCD